MLFRPTLREKAGAGMYFARLRHTAPRRRSCLLHPRNDQHSENNFPLDNQQIAARLDEVAELLEAQGANLFRVRAYRAAAQTLRNLEHQAHEILDQEGVEGLTRLPGIGESLGRS